MSDTVKLIIEIPKEEYELIVGDEACGLHPLTRAVAHGIPLDDVTAEIADLPTNMFEAYKLKSRVLYMLDNIGKAESEDKE